VCLTADDVCRSGTAEAGKDASSSQPSKRFQQTQAQVDEVHMLDIFRLFYLLMCQLNSFYFVGKMMMMVKMMMPLGDVNRTELTSKFTN